MPLSNLLVAIPWTTVAGVAILLAGMTLIALGLGYDRTAPAPVRRREDAR